MKFAPSKSRSQLYCFFIYRFFQVIISSFSWSFSIANSLFWRQVQWWLTLFTGLFCNLRSAHINGKLRFPISLLNCAGELLSPELPSRALLFASWHNFFQNSILKSFKWSYRGQIILPQSDVRFRISHSSGLKATKIRQSRSCISTTKSFSWSAFLCAWGQLGIPDMRAPGAQLL